MIVALGTFGTNVNGTILGVQIIVKSDQRLINGYERRADRLRRRLHNMSAQLRAPFHDASSLRLLSPEEALAELAGNG